MLYRQLLFHFRNKATTSADSSQVIRLQFTPKIIVSLLSNDCRLRHLCTSSDHSKTSQHSASSSSTSNQESEKLDQTDLSNSKSIPRFEKKPFSRWLIASSVGLFAGTMLITWYYDTLKSSLSRVASRFGQNAEPNASRSTKSGVINLPEHVKYLIIGAGTAGFAAFRAIRGADADARVLVIGDEEHYPYMRPPLSKELWFSDDPNVASTLKFKQWSGKERHLFYEKQEFYCDPGTLNEKTHGCVSIVRGRKVIKLDPTAHEATLDNGKTVKFDKCLIATGGKPKSLQQIERGGEQVMKRVTLYRTLEDFLKLDKILHECKSIAIVGGGLLGSELACGIAHKVKNRSLKITQLFPESGNMNKLLPNYLSAWTTDKLKHERIEVIPNVTVEKAVYDKGQVHLHTADGKTIAADHVIVAVGIEPNVELAKSAGLEVDPEIGGFRCDAELRARTDIYVAGDCCSFYDQQLGRRRVEHQDHAVITGRLAGQNMAGGAVPYKQQSMFWSDLGPHLGFEAVGIVDSSLPTVGVFAKDSKSPENTAVDKVGGGSTVQTETVNKNKHDFNKGIIFYLRNSKIVGILLWNLYNRIPIARRILKHDEVYEDLNEVAKLFNIHDSPPVSSTAKDSSQELNS